jgi:predicted ribosome quality control (RQC) complex YloA/Tae2 family protein
MRIKLKFTKSLEENASYYFEKSKRAKQKLEKTKKAVRDTKKKLENAEKITSEEIKEEKKKKKLKKVIKKKKWYQNFRWFMSSDGFLVVGGRDATSNEIIVKKHASGNDIVFHTQMAGSPFVVIKNPLNKDIPDSTIQQAADFCVSFSRAFDEGLQTSEVYYVKPEQLSRKTKAGEYMGKGAFMVYGKRNYTEGRLNVAVGNYNGTTMSGPVEAVEKHCKKYVVLKKGKEKKSELAKKIRHLLELDDLDEIIRFIPKEAEIDKKSQ